jgi:hypothetical protein
MIGRTFRYSDDVEHLGGMLEHICDLSRHVRGSTMWNTVRSFLNDKLIMREYEDACERDHEDELERLDDLRDAAEDRRVEAALDDWRGA